MRRLVAFGNNVTQNIKPQDTTSYIHSPTDVSDELQSERIIWHSWECTIGRATDGTIHAGGCVPAIDSKLEFDKLVGHDEPVGYLKDARLHLFNGQTPKKTFVDVVITGLGDVFAIFDGAVHHYASLDALMEDEEDYSHSHHHFDAVTLHAMESRCFVQAHNHLFEVLPVGLRLVEEIEGLGIKSIVTGRRNRLGILTEAGDAYILDTKAKEPSLVELEEEEEVRFIGLGSDFDLVVTESKVLTRGSSEFACFSELNLDAFGQLGREGTEDWAEIDVEASAVVDVHCARWSTILTLDT